MAGNTGATVQSNETFTTGVVSLATGVLNPPNSPQNVWDCGVGMTYASITTAVTGSPASFTILLEGTYDGANWTTLATCTNTAGETQFSTGLVPFTNLRARCTAVSGGTLPTVNVFATASQTPFQNTGGGTSPATTVNQGAANLGITLGWPVAQGVINPITNLNAATTGVTGAVSDFQEGRSSAMFQVVVTGAPTGGTITFLASIDGVTYIPLTTASVFAGTAGTITAGVLNASGTTNCIIAPGAAGNNTIALRYFRADNTTLTGGTAPTVTVKSIAF